MRRPSTRCIASRAVIALAATVILTMAVHPAEKNQTRQPASTLTNGTYRPFLINNVFAYYANNGDEAFNPFSSDYLGFESPRGTYKHFLFEAGPLWGGLHKGRATAKVGGSVYRHALQAGPLLTSGTPTTDPVAADPADPAYRVYRVRPDVRPDIPFTTVEGMLNDDEVPFITRYESVTARGLYDQYIADWNEWPAALGAPFTDVDKNGVYDPAVDIPGRPGADQTLWYVANDMIDSLTQRLAGSPPIGLEVHRTIWGYRRAGATGNAIFTSTVLINKSGAPVDSMYFAQWADTELGEPGDDLVGCDTTLDLGYTYNGRSWDGYLGGAPPAAGFALLQGPMVPGAPTDTAMFLSSRRPGFRGLHMTAFTYYGDAILQFADPPQGSGGDVEWYRQMRGLAGRTGMPYADPVTGLFTPLCVAGDPVKATDGGAGWVDGLGATVARDKRLAMSTGPFTLAAGDTQEVVIACLTAQGADRLASISALRAGVRTVQTAFRFTDPGHPMPVVSCSVVSDTAVAGVTVRLDARKDPITGGSVTLTTSGGVVLATIPLADDGMHGDVVAGDGVWTGTTHIPVRSSGLTAGIEITYAGGGAVRWENAVDHIATARLSVSWFGVASDNINSDGIANPGENVRFTFFLRNDAPFDLHRIVTSSSPVAGNGRYTISILNGHATIEPVYDPANAGSYFHFDVPAGYQDTTFRVALVTTDDSLNVWRDTLVFPVRPLPATPYQTPVRHAEGMATGAYTIRIVDPTKVKDHLYVIRGGAGQAGAGSYTLKDSTTGTVLLQDHAAPDTLGHTSPVVDGFKVLRGTISANQGMRTWSVPRGTRRFSPVAGFTGVGLEGFSTISANELFDRENGTIGAAGNFIFGGIGTSLRPWEYHTVLLKLAAVNNVGLWDPKSAPADTNFSRGYRYLQEANLTVLNPSFLPWIIDPSFGYPYQDHNYSVPFSAWDMDVTPPVRLAVGLMERNASAGFVDGRYWPGIGLGNEFSRETAFIFQRPYAEAVDTTLAVNLLNNAATPLMWVIGCARRFEVPWVSGDEFMITAYSVPSPADVWVFHPPVVAGVGQEERPASFALMQNYPNPFNPSTTIRYDLPVQSEVTITVYDVLGRAVRHLVRSVRPAGSHAVLWHGDTDAGAGVASGVYFYRYTAARSDRSGQYEQTLKMILLR